MHTIGGDAERSLYTYSDLSECAQKIDDGKDSAKCQILFLPGYPSPDWISRIGALCHTHPDYFNTIMRFRCRRDYYSVPTLHSGTENIITLRFVTLGSREMRAGESDQDQVDALRLDGERAMKKYEHDLMIGKGLESGDSIVRSFSALDERNFFIEQEMSICLHKYEQGWISEYTIRCERLEYFLLIIYSIDIHRRRQRYFKWPTRPMADRRRSLLAFAMDYVRSNYPTLS